MAVYIGASWQLYEQFIKNKDNGFFTTQNQPVKVGLLTNSFQPNLSVYSVISDIPISDWAIDEQSSHYSGTLTMLDSPDYTNRLAILTSGEATFDAVGSDFTCLYAVLYESDSGSDRLIATLLLEGSLNDITVIQSDTLSINMSVSDPIYRQALVD